MNYTKATLYLSSGIMSAVWINMFYQISKKNTFKFEHIDKMDLVPIL